MTSDDKELSRISEMMNKRGHASMFAVETREDRQIMELSTAHEWSKSMRLAYGVEISGIKSNHSDPPDCFGMYRGSVISIELTELVKPEILVEIDRARKGGRKISAHDRLYDQAQWDDAVFERRINDLLDRKEASYAKTGTQIDVLVVHTDEPLLLPAEVELWLKELDFEQRSTLKNAYLLLTYDPAAGHWPVLRLYGSI